MTRWFHFVNTALAVLVFLSYPDLYGETSNVEPVVDSYKKQEKGLSQKRFKRKEWSKGQQAELTEKTFSFEHWNKYYSSLGSKKWNYKSEKVSERKRFDTSLSKLFKKNRDIELSEWQGYLASLESQAQISTDATARITQNRRIYESMLQQAKHFKDTGEEVSLRDINRFQFRKNRPKDDVPTTQAGSGDEAH